MGGRVGSALLSALARPVMSAGWFCRLSTWNFGIVYQSKSTALNVVFGGSMVLPLSIPFGQPGAPLMVGPIEWRRSGEVPLFFRLAEYLIVHPCGYHMTSTRMLTISKTFPLSNQQILTRNFPDKSSDVLMSRHQITGLLNVFGLMEADKGHYQLASCGNPHTTWKCKNCSGKLKMKYRANHEYGRIVESVPCTCSLQTRSPFVNDCPKLSSMDEVLRHILLHYFSRKIPIVSCRKSAPAGFKMVALDGDRAPTDDAQTSEEPKRKKQRTKKPASLYFELPDRKWFHIYVVEHRCAAGKTYQPRDLPVDPVKAAKLLAVDNRKPVVVTEADGDKNPAASEKKEAEEETATEADGDKKPAASEEKSATDDTCVLCLSAPGGIALSCKNGGHARMCMDCMMRYVHQQCAPNAPNGAYFAEVMERSVQCPVCRCSGIGRYTLIGNSGLLGDFPIPFPQGIVVGRPYYSDEELTNISLGFDTMCLPLWQDRRNCEQALRVARGNLTAMAQAGATSSRLQAVSAKIVKLEQELHASRLPDWAVDATCAKPVPLEGFTLSFKHFPVRRDGFALRDEALKEHLNKFDRGHNPWHPEMTKKDHVPPHMSEVKTHPLTAWKVRKYELGFRVATKRFIDTLEEFALWHLVDQHKDAPVTLKWIRQQVADGKSHAWIRNNMPQPTLIDLSEVNDGS